MALLETIPGSALIDFGDVSTGGTAQLDILLRNVDAWDPIVIGTPTSDDGEFVVAGGGTTLDPGQETTVTIIYTAGAPGAASALITIPGDAANMPIVLSVTALSVAAGTIAISISPPSWAFGETKVGEDSSVKTFIITNEGTVNVTIQIPVVTLPFVGIGLPAGPTVLIPGTTMNILVVFRPTLAGYVTDVDGLAITSDAPSSVNNVKLEGLAVLIHPAYIVTDGVERAYAAFRHVLQQFDPTNFNCETDAYAEKLLSFMPGYEANMPKLELQYEDRGMAIVAVLITNERDQTKFQSNAIGTLAALRKIRNMLFDLGIEGELLTLRITPTGPMWMCAYAPRVIPAGEVKKV